MQKEFRRLYGSATALSLAHRDPKLCVVLVPYINRIEHETDTSLRILEARGYEVWRTPGYSAVDQARNRMAYDALYRRGFNELFWIDSDVAFDPDDFERVRNHNLPVCAAAYPFKGFPRFTIETFDNTKLVFGKNGGLVKIKSAATGFLYTHRAVYEGIRHKFKLKLCNTSFDAPMYPFFQPQVFEEGDNFYYLGEDFSFCRRAIKAGFNIWLDTRVRLGHIGLYRWQWEDIVNPPQKQKYESIEYDVTKSPVSWSHTGSLISTTIGSNFIKQYKID